MQNAARHIVSVNPSKLKAVYRWESAGSRPLSSSSSVATTRQCSRSEDATSVSMLRIEAHVVSVTDWSTGTCIHTGGVQVRPNCFAAKELQFMMYDSQML